MQEKPVVVTVRQPWASAILYAGKDVENRRWRPAGAPMRLVVHAAREADQEAIGEAPAELPHITARGVLLGDVMVLGSHRCEGQCSPWADPGLWHWELHDPRPLARPVPARGERGLWRLADPTPYLRERTPRV